MITAEQLKQHDADIERACNALIELCQQQDGELRALVPGMPKASATAHDAILAMAFDSLIVAYMKRHPDKAGAALVDAFTINVAYYLLGRSNAATWGDTLKKFGERCAQIAQSAAAMDTLFGAIVGAARRPGR